MDQISVFHVSPSHQHIAAQKASCASYSFRGNLKLSDFNSTRFNCSLSKLVLFLLVPPPYRNRRKVFEFFSIRGSNNGCYENTCFS